MQTMKTGDLARFGKRFAVFTKQVVAFPQALRPSPAGLFHSLASSSVL